MNLKLSIANVIIFTFILLSVFACSKKGNVTPIPTPAPVVTPFVLSNKWFVTVDTQKTYINSVLNGATPILYYHTDYFQFNADGTGTQSFGPTIFHFNYTVDGSAITLNYPAEQLAPSLLQSAGIYTGKMLNVHGTYFTLSLTFPSSPPDKGDTLKFISVYNLNLN